MPVTRKSDVKGGGGDIRGTKTFDRRKQSSRNPSIPGASAAGTTAPSGGGDTAGTHEDDDALAAFFQEVKQDEAAISQDIRKASIILGQKFFKLGPDFIDEDFLECTPVPLYEQMIPVLDYDSYLDKSDDLVQVTPIRPQTFSALFAFYRDRGPALNWDPSLTDLEEDCFFQEVINFPTSKLAYILPRERKKDRVKKRRVKIFKPNGDFVVKTRLYIDLVETPTIFLIEIVGSWVPENDANIDAIKERNDKYDEVIQRHSVPATASLAHDYSQTFESYKLSEYTDYKIQGCADIGTECHMYYIEDEYRRVAAEEIKRKIRENEEQQARLATEKALQDAPEVKNSDEDSSGDEEDTTVRVDLSLYKDDEDRDEEKQILIDEASADEIPMSSDDDDEFEIRLPLQTIYDRKRHHNKHRGLRMYPDISFSIIALERIICMDSQQENQADMRGFTQEEVKIVIGPAVEEAVGDAVDEDVMVDLLIQQHRMQEQLEKPEGDQGGHEAGEITEADILRMQAEVEAVEEGADEDAEMAGGGKNAASKVEEPTITATTVEDDEKDAFDLALDDGAIMEHDDDGMVALLDEQGGNRQGGGGQDTEDRSGYLERFGADDYDSMSSRLSGERGGQVVLGNLRCEWTDSAERETDFRDEFNEAKAAEEIIVEEKLNLPSVNDDDDIEYVPPTLPADPAEIALEKKEMFEGLVHTFPDLVKIPKVPTPEEIKAQEAAMVEQEDDVSDQSDGDEDSRLSDHVGFDEDVEDSSDNLSPDDAAEVAAFKDLSARRSSISRHFALKTAQSEIPSLMETDGPHLKQFWEFNAKITRGKEVTDIALHPSNGNLIAVSYGTFQFGKESSEGLVCVWNAKNNRSPERTYFLKSPPTTLAFSEFSPYILAVGMLDGNIVMYDVRESDPAILWSTYAQEDRHLGPVWVIYWLVEEDSANELSVSESMLSLGDDGYLKRWSMAKGLESVDVMKVMRSTMQIPGRREKRNESLITTLSTAYTVCFFSDNTELFLLGTEEGFIHKCSTAYKDQYVSTYVGHTGPVYRICFSVFDETVFVSCGGDWTIRIWKTDHPTPLLSMNTGLRTIFDVACSLYSSTIFICCAEFHIEVWDLSINTLEPAVQQHLHNDLGLRKVAFNGSLNSVIIGDDDGGVHIFGLRKFPKPQIGRGAQIDSLMEALLPGYKKRQKETSAGDASTLGSQNLKSVMKSGGASASASSAKVSDTHTDEHGRTKSTRSGMAN